MNNLFSYILAMKEECNELSVVETVLNEQTDEEDDLTTKRSELSVKFNNGVTIKKSIERELSDDISEAICEECWISYEVIQQPEYLNVQPNKKHFTNHCQEKFWLKINRIQSVS